MVLKCKIIKLQGTDVNGVRYDKFEKPELHRGIYEFAVNKEYNGKRDPK